MFDDMHVFDDKIFSQEDCRILSRYSDKFEKKKQSLLNTQFKTNAARLNCAKSLEELIILNKACTLGDEYYKALTDYEYTIDEKKVLLYGFINNINVTEQLQGGETLDNLKLIIAASTHSDFKINDFFDETGSYLNYAKLKNFLKSK